MGVKKKKESQVIALAVCHQDLSTLKGEPAPCPIPLFPSDFEDHTQRINLLNSQSSVFFGMETGCQEAGLGFTTGPHPWSQILKVLVFMASGDGDCSWLWVQGFSPEGVQETR